MCGDKDIGLMFHNFILHPFESLCEYSVVLGYFMEEFDCCSRKMFNYLTCSIDLKTKGKKAFQNIFVSCVKALRCMAKGAKK